MSTSVPRLIQVETRTIRRSDVLAALKREGKETQGLAIPRSTRISRELRLLGRQEATALATQALSEVFTPLRNQQCHPSRANPRNERNAHRTRDDTRLPGATSSSSSVVFISGTHETRVSVHARLSCPPPVISTGNRVTLVARSGAVRDSARTGTSRRHRRCDSRHQHNQQYTANRPRRGRRNGGGIAMNRALILVGLPLLTLSACGGPTHIRAGGERRRNYVPDEYAVPNPCIRGFTVAGLQSKSLREASRRTCGWHRHNSH